MTEDQDGTQLKLAAARTMLFVPGSRPDRFDKAAGAAAGAVILDLEDAVAPDDKERARNHVADWLRHGGPNGEETADGGDFAPAVVRINPPGTPWHDADLETVAACGAAVMLPKAGDPEVLRRAGGGCALIPLLETAAGVERAGELCAVEGVVRAAFGSVDLAAQLGVAHDDLLALTHARSRLVLASAAAGIAPPLDGVTTHLSESGALVEEIQHARRLGFGGKMCIHPAQLPTVDEGFAPSEEELDWARTVAGAADGVAVVDGRMIDKPLRERAARLLAAETL